MAVLLWNLFLWNILEEPFFVYWSIVCFEVSSLLFCVLLRVGRFEVLRVLASYGSCWGWLAGWGVGCVDWVVEWLSLAAG